MADDIKVTMNTGKLDELIDTLPSGNDDTVRAMAFEVEGNAKASFGTGPAGRSYKRGSVIHVASAPPGPPAVDTGNLRAGVHSWPVSQGTWRVGDSTGEDGYGLHQEVGTPHIAPRPWLFPAYFKMAQNFANKFRGLFK